ncbi:MAG: galactosyltransferase-related protein [Euryarchaeota archaeon]|jgi:cell division protein FtsB|uniref:galactosyltransferase-related protein n=1 Tax=Methanobacterium sp. MZD130B TaxID=3394378 RepID=UPI0039FDA304|nr:galactosyltransferase-related protein [Euryarchaeota archaeon]
MIKEQIKKQIKKTGTYQSVEIENEKLRNHINNLQNHTNNIKSSMDKLKNENSDLKRLINNLKAENTSLKELYLETNISSQNYNNLTVIMPFRKTNDYEREENLDIMLKYLFKIGIKNLIIPEHADESYKDYLINNYGKFFNSFEVIFTYANGGLFNKAHAINKGVTSSTTPYFAIVDMDCLTEKKNFDMAIYLLERGFEVVHPFNRIVQDIIDKESFKKNFDFRQVKTTIQYRDWADGGIVFWNKSAFIDIGMKNEYFSGWGGEDNEIIIRANLFGLKQIRLDETLYHLYHPRPQIRTKNNVEQMEKILKIQSKEELLHEISKWPWIEKDKM